jgi:hypothetical protein
MATQQLLPEDLVRRLKYRRGREVRFFQRLLEQALPADEDEDDPLYQPPSVEQNECLATEMAEWDATVEDGLVPEAIKAAGA